MTSSLFVTDTHPLIWYITDETRKLPKKVIKIFDDAVQGHKVIFVPLVVIWELSMALKSGKVRLAASLDDYVRERFFAKAISVLSIELEDILQFHKLSFTSDPFDTLIVAMAQRMDCPLITGDSIIHSRRPCKLFWD